MTSRLFPGVVRDAIAYGRPDASEAGVEAAARQDRDDRAGKIAEVSTHAEMLGRGGSHAALWARQGLTGRRP
jgi:ABC-type multidrug transport system fused ATPase/permease subunit